MVNMRTNWALHCYLFMIIDLALFSTAASPLSITTKFLPAVTVDQFYKTVLLATGGTPPYKWSLARQEDVPYPYSFSFISNGTLSGTATFASRYSPRIQVQDSQGTVVVQRFDLIVFPSPVLAINSGGAIQERFDKDNSAGTIEGDSVGLNYSVTNAIDVTGVINPAPKSVYQSERYGNPNLVYTVAGLRPDMKPRLTVGITYLVRLHFAEIRQIKQGARQFNVAISGRTVLTNFDIVKETGAPFKAIVKEFTATAIPIRGSNIGAIIISLSTGAAGVPKISGIEILPATVFITQTPVVPDDTDERSYELGMKFWSTVPGSITALRFWKSARETGMHIGHLWSGFGLLLANVSFTALTNSGWQEASLDKPVSISANTLYVASVNIQQYFGSTESGLAYPGITNGFLQASGIEGNGNGVFGDVGQFPTSSYNNTNYFIDVVFTSQF